MLAACLPALNLRMHPALRKKVVFAGLLKD
jgi:hypothetical protein